MILSKVKVDVGGCCERTDRIMIFRIASALLKVFILSLLTINIDGTQLTGGGDLDVIN